MERFDELNELTEPTMSGATGVPAAALQPGPQDHRHRGHWEWSGVLHRPSILHLRLQVCRLGTLAGKMWPLNSISGSQHSLLPSLYCCAPKLMNAFEHPLKLCFLLPLYALHRQGPSVSTDTACSSSLVAAHLAHRHLLAGDTQVPSADGLLHPALSVWRCHFHQASSPVAGAWPVPVSHG